MRMASKIHNILLVQIQPEERLAAPSELNLASSIVTDCGEASGMGYGAATQLKGFSPCSEAICWSCGCKSHHCNSQFDNVVISNSRWGDSTAQRRVTYDNKLFYWGAPCWLPLCFQAQVRVSAAVITVDDSGSADYVCRQTAEVAE